MCDKCPIFNYVMQELVHEERALPDESQQEEKTVGEMTWIHVMVLRLYKRYYGG